MEYQIITDGAADITKEEGAKRGIVVVPFYVYSTQDVNRKFADADELYEEMLKNPKEVFKTACPSPEEYYRKFRAAVDEGEGRILRDDFAEVQRLLQQRGFSRKYDRGRDAGCEGARY